MSCERIQDIDEEKNNIKYNVDFGFILSYSINRILLNEGEMFLNRNISHTKFDR